MKTKLHTTADVADWLGVSQRRVRFLAAEKKVGFQMSGRWFFTTDDRRALRPRPTPGRPRESSRRRSR